ncbi:MAG: hypothetical protein GHCLOJNM_00437 [bacterium]|nr:hypothetical protein [bacterium]
MTRLAWASLGLFLLHLPLLIWVEGEFTDGVLQVAYFDPPTYVVAEGAGPARYVPPGYPALIRVAAPMGLEGHVAGRLLSMAAHALTAYILAWVAWRLARDPKHNLPETEFPWLVWSLWALSPMGNRWSFHAMSDMTFCLFATLAVGCFLVCNLSVCPARTIPRLWLLGNLAGIAAFGTRYQGMALAPIALFSLLILHLRGRGARTSPWPLSTAGVLWVGAVAALWGGFTIHEQQFAERTHEFALYRDFAVAGLRALPYAVTPPLLLLGCIGLFRAVAWGKVGMTWAFLGLLGGVLGLILQTRFLSFQFRYGLPLLPWLCLLAGSGAAWLPRFYSRAAWGFTALWLLVLSSAVLYYQHETFADMARLAREVPKHRKAGGILWACEEYNPDYRNVKVSVWSGQSARWLAADSLGQVKPGDLLFDSNIYSIPTELLQQLRRRFKLTVVAEATSETVPLFPGEFLRIPVGPPGQERTLVIGSQPEVMAYRFIRQYYASVLYRVTGATPGNEETGQR